MPESRDRRRNGDRCSPAAAKYFRPAANLLHDGPFSLFQHARAQPFLDEPQEAPVRDPMLEELDQPFVRRTIEKAVTSRSSTQFTLLPEPHIEQIQRIDADSVPVGTRTEKSRKSGSYTAFSTSTVARWTSLSSSAVTPRRTLPPVVFRDVRSAHRLGAIRSPLQSMGEVLEVLLEVLSVVPPRLSVHPRRRLPFQLRVGKPKRFDGVDVVDRAR